MNSATFLGTGGGRFVMLTQRRASAGIWVKIDGRNYIIDPGPGAIIHALKHGFDPGSLDGIFCTHNHLDHYGEVEVMVEAMTHGLHRRHGILYLQEDVVKYISQYHRDKTHLVPLHPNDKTPVESSVVDVLPTHQHSNGVGLKFNTSSGVFTYAGDTGYNMDLAKNYVGSKILVLNTIFPTGHPAKTHLNTDYAAEIALTAKPEKLVITHFGIRMLNVGPEKQAEIIRKKTNIDTVAAYDGMTVQI
ncbi:MAG: MBL fold metallo-hydrolase [Candidatus Altiarchaeota archaeon]|nr:MBL fold metallo-hydrolase [Candidatus Altiarchaeota archaeon]